MIKSIIFDFDGVILNSNNIKAEAFGELYNKYGKKIENQVVEYHYDNLGISRIEKIKYFHKVFLKYNIEDQEIKLLTNKFSAIVFKKIIKTNFIKGAYEFISNYHNDFDLHISSATPTDELKKICKAINILKFFKSINGSPKKKKEHIKSICKINDLRISNLVFIGDSKNDLETAKDLDIKFIYIGKKNDIEIVKNVRISENLINLKSIIKKINLS